MKHTSIIYHIVLNYRHIWSPYHKTAPLVHLPGELGLVGCLSRELFQVMGGSFLDRKTPCNWGWTRWTPELVRKNVCCPYLCIDVCSKKFVYLFWWGVRVATQTRDYSGFTWYEWSDLFLLSTICVSSGRVGRYHVISIYSFSHRFSCRWESFHDSFMVFHLISEFPFYPSTNSQLRKWECMLLDTILPFVVI